MISPLHFTMVLSRARTADWLVLLATERWELCSLQSSFVLKSDSDVWIIFQKTNQR